MRRKSWVNFAVPAALLLAAISFVPNRHAYAADGNPYWGANHFPNVTLTTQDGKQVKFYDDLIKGKQVVINFVFTRCGNVCPLETAKLGQVYKLLGDRMGKDIFFYSITVDPKRDSPAVLKEYSEKFHTGPGWYFLTGKKEDIDAVRRSIGMAGRPNEDPLSGHTTSITIGNETTNQWFVDSSFDDPRYLAIIIGDWLSSWKYAKKGPSYADRPAMDPAETQKGAAVFRTACAACHTVGGGDYIGPDLAGVTNVRDHSWLVRFISQPDKVLAEKDPIATALFNRYNRVNMPNLKLGERDVDSLISFIESISQHAHHQNMAGAQSGGTTR